MAAVLTRRQSTGKLSYRVQWLLGGHGARRDSRRRSPTAAAR